MEFSIKIHDKSVERELHTHTYAQYTYMQVFIVVYRHHVQCNIFRIKADNGAFIVTILYYLHVVIRLDFFVVLDNYTIVCVLMEICGGFIKE